MSLLKLKLVGSLNHQRSNGFTLIELLVVIVISGVLAAIALPTLLNQAVKAKQAEAKTYIGSINRAQQAYNLQNLGFASTLNQLGLGILSTPNYSYSIQLDSSGRYAVHHASSTADTLKPYVGMTAIVYPGGQNVALETILCEAEDPIAGQAVAPTYALASTSCTPGTRPLN